MIAQPTEEDLKKLRILHDKIKNHDFRKAPEKYLLDEYANLLDHEVTNYIGQFAHGDYDEKNHRWNYKYYRYVRDRWLHYKDSSKPDGYFHYNDTAEIWSNPNIALYNEAMHDYRGIIWALKANWDNEYWHKYYFAKFTETSEKLLMLLHALIDGVQITEMSFPKERKEGQTEYKMVQNPLYNNDWTLEKYLHKEWYEDKGYVD